MDYLTCVFERDANVTTCDIASLLQPPRPQPNAPTTTTRRPTPTTAHDRPATTTSQRMKVTAHKRSRPPTNDNERSTMAHKRRPAPTSRCE
ncbi:hypothetical protein K443DRAFT_627725 [Laccaria amethystina LaAM-08-1]|uniref:Uncharacterized protein n=1 Tax=Laccaria amethystina LaAM-08-1 TaxID=1095629 RepID=A0A0C9XAT5_9AGAR|nr:hypothetical protein K443DRAFT_627725 [Laccaria amethystina LaAM-08-1]